MDFNQSKEMFSVQSSHCNLTVRGKKPQSIATIFFKYSTHSLVLATAHSQPPSVETMKGRQYISRYITDLTINYLSISKSNQSVEKLDLARPLLN